MIWQHALWDSRVDQIPAEATLTGEFAHSHFDRLMKRCLEVPSRITVVREEHFVSPKARPSFSYVFASNFVGRIYKF